MGLKRIVAAALFLLFGVAPAVLPATLPAPSLSSPPAGSPAPPSVSYRFESVTSGIGEQRIDGVVEADGPKMRINIAHGDGVTFPDRSFALSSDGRRIVVCDPSAKTYYEMFADALIAEGNKVPSLLGVFDSITTTNAHYNIRDLGNGGTIAGYPTRRTATSSSYDLHVTVIDHKVVVHVTVNSESWTTDKLPASLANFMQLGSVRTGVQGIDRLLTADPRAPRGFPLKTVTTLRIVQNEMPIEVTSTTNVSNIETKAFPATEFAMPAGYRRVDSPFEKAVKALK
jgi:hypothetical protein